MKYNSAVPEAEKVLLQLSSVIENLSAPDYVQKIPIIGNASIGEHTRHVIELFQQLLLGYENGVIDYDNRKRDLNLQSDKLFAVDAISSIIDSLAKDDKDLKVASIYNPSQASTSSYGRELLYNIEHCIHHQAIVLVGLKILGYSPADEHFGVAKSTILYRKQCAQ